MFGGANISLHLVSSSASLDCVVEHRLRLRDNTTDGRRRRGSYLLPRQFHHTSTDFPTLRRRGVLPKTTAALRSRYYEVRLEYGSPCVHRSPVAHLCQIDTVRRWMLLPLVVTYIHPLPLQLFLSFRFTPSRVTGRTHGRPDGTHFFPPFPYHTLTVVGPNFPILCGTRRGYFPLRWTRRAWRRWSGLDTDCASSFLHCIVIDFINLSSLLDKVVSRISDRWGTKRRLTRVNSYSFLRFPCTSYCFTTTSWPSDTRSGAPAFIGGGIAF